MNTVAEKNFIKRHILVLGSLFKVLKFIVLTSLIFEPASVFGNTINNIIFNEVDSDTPGTDMLEFVELYDGGIGNTDLTALVVVFYNGTTDTSYAALDLDGFATDENGYFLIGQSGVLRNPDIIFSGIQNGADAVALYMADDTDFPNGTPRHNRESD